ncbi:hypothetical protein ACWD6P_29090 [Streptomyces sp. NPDC002446]
MRTGAFLHPWDVAGDPDAAARLAGLGVQQVTLGALRAPAAADPG